MTVFITADAKLKKLYKTVDEIVKNQVCIISDKNNDEDPDVPTKLTRQEKFQKAVMNYLSKDLDFFKIFLLLLLSPYGLTKNDIALYLMDGKYANATDADGNTLPPAGQIEKIKKNVNYVEKNIAHLESLLYLFYPTERHALKIITKDEKTKAKAIRYRFQDQSKARSLFENILDYKDDIAITPTITQKERDTIKEQCLEDFVKKCEIFNNDSKTRTIINKLIKAIKKKTLCEIKHVTKEKLVYLLPLMIRQSCESNYSYLVTDPEDITEYSDLLYKYINYDPGSYIVIGIQFEGEYKGNRIEWYTNAKKQYLILQGIRKISLLKELPEESLEKSKAYLEYNHDIYKLNPYRNLCGEDFYLLIPNDFYMFIPNHVKRKLFNLDGSDPLKMAEEWKITCGDYLYSTIYGPSVWELPYEEDFDKFNLSKFNENREYALVKCKNYLELLNVFNQHHLILPQETLPYELVETQFFEFVKTYLDEGLIASPHHRLQREQAVTINDDKEYIKSSYDVFRESDINYRKKKENEYISKFGYKDLTFIREYEPFNFNFDFCKSLCYICKKGAPQEYGIPLCITESNNKNYLIYWDYENLEKILSKIERFKIRQNDFDYITRLDLFVKETKLDSDKIEKIDAELYLELLSIPLDEIYGVHVIHDADEKLFLEEPHGRDLELNDESKQILEKYVNKELKPNAKLDDLTNFSREYFVFFDKSDYQGTLYLPDSFKITDMYGSVGELLKYKLPEKVENLLYLMEVEGKDMCFVSFVTHRRSEVIKFLHENMGRVGYLDMSEDGSDPLGILKELKEDNQKIMAGWEVAWDCMKE